MKHVILLILSTIISANTMFSQSWQTIGSSSASVSTANFSVVVVDDNIPYIAYQDGDQGNKVTVKKYINGAWTTIGNAGFTAGGATYIKLAFYNHTPYVAYTDYSVSQKASVMKYDGTSWIQVGNAGFTGGLTSHLDLLIDNSGTPYVSMLDYYNSNKLSVYYFNGTNWIQKGGLGFSYGTAYYTSLAKDSNGDLYVACVENNFASQIRVFKFNGTGWQELGAYASEANCWMASLAIDGTTPYLAYCTSGTSGVARVRKFENGAWVNISNASTQLSSWTNMKIRNGVIYLAFTETNNYNPVLKSYAGERWTTVGASSIASVTANYMNMDLKSDGTPIVVFKNITNANKIATYFYGTSINTAVDEISYEPNAFYPNPAYDQLFFRNTDSSINQILNSEGKLLLSTHESQLNISRLSAGFYIIRTVDMKGGITTGKLVKR